MSNRMVVDNLIVTKDALEQFKVAIKGLRADGYRVFMSASKFQTTRIDGDSKLVCYKVNERGRYHGFSIDWVATRMDRINRVRKVRTQLVLGKRRMRTNCHGFYITSPTTMLKSCYHNDFSSEHFVHLVLSFYKLLTCGEPC